MGLKCSLLQGNWSAAEHLLSHHLLRRDMVSLHLGFDAESWFRVLGFEQFKPKFVPQEQGRSENPFPAIASEILKLHNLLINTSCDNLMCTKE